MSSPEEIWLPLVDEPVGDIVARIQAEDPEIDRLVGSPHRILAFRTFAYIRVGLLLGELLFEQDLDVVGAQEVGHRHRDQRKAGHDVAGDARRGRQDPDLAPQAQIGRASCRERV